MFKISLLRTNGKRERLKTESPTVRTLLESYDDRWEVSNKEVALAK